MKCVIRKLTAVFCAVLLLGMTACGSSKSAPEMGVEMTSGYDSAAMEEIVAEEAYAEEAAPEMEEDKVQTEDFADPASSRKLIYYRDYEIQTTKYDELSAAIDDLIAEYGAYVESGSEWGGYYEWNETRNANLSIRVPTDSLGAFEEALLLSLGEDGAVTNRSERVEDITLQYVDVESRIESLETEKERLLELLAEAEDVETIITIEGYLSDVRYELENYASTKRLYDSQVSYSYLSIYIEEVAVVDDVPASTIGQRIVSGWQKNLKDFRKDAENLLVFVVVKFPYLLFWGAVFFIAFRLIRRWFKKKAAKKPKNIPPVMPPVCPEKPQEEKPET